MEYVNVLILENILDIVTVLLTYGTLGHYLIYGEKEYLAIYEYKTDYEDPEFETVIFNAARGMYRLLKCKKIPFYSPFISGFTACLIGSAILRTFLAGRLHLIGVIVLSFTYSIIASLEMRCVWKEDGFFHAVKLNESEFRFLDSGGAINLHIIPSVIGLIGALCLGRRLILVQQIDAVSINPPTIYSTIRGYLMVYFGLMFATIPISNEKDTNFIINGLIAFGIALVLTIVCNFFIHFKNLLNYWNVIRCLQGGVAGFVAITAFIDTPVHLMALIASSVICILSMITLYIVHFTCLEDNCNIIAVHLLCGFLSVLIAPICVEQDANLARLATYVLVQFVICFLIMLLTIFVVCVVFFFMWVFNISRNKYEEENHDRADDYIDQVVPKCCIGRLFRIHLDSIYLTKDKIYD